jgi:hypothetical protein
MTSTCLNAAFTGSITMSLTNSLGQVVTAVAAGREINYEITSGVLPPGILMSGDAQNPAIILFTGTATTVGEYPFVIRAQIVHTTEIAQIVEATDQRRYVINIAAIANASLPDGEVGSAYSQQLTVDGPTTGAELWQVTSGTLPAGLSLDSATGEITGTPTLEESQTFIVCFSNGL